MLKYRPEIDGLRAVAVLGVLGYHTHIISGGFFGVDVFLVISGFLIGSILITNLKNGTFRFAAFYERRARRILPALLVVLLLTVPFAWENVFPKAFLEYARSVLATLLFVSNYYFVGEDAYIAEPSQLKPFLHTWSLSLEEQFYFSFPLLIFLVFRFARKQIRPLLLLSVSCSFLYAVWAPERNAAFYLLPGRLWEFFVGVLLAEVSFPQLRSQLLSFLLPTVGMVAIVASFLFCNDLMRHPSFITLIPVVGTALILIYGAAAGPINWILSLKIPVKIGLISYSLYLWHQPILVFQRLNKIGPTPWFEKISVLALIFLAAYLSWRWIERPFRQRNTVSFRQMWMSLLVTAVFLGVFSMVGLYSQGYTSRFPPILAKGNPTQAWWELKQNGNPCHRNTRLEPCVFNIAPEGDRWFLLGDSHAGVIAAPLLKRLHTESAASLTTFLWGGCPFVVGVRQVREEHPISCEKANRYKMNYLLSQNPGIVVISQRAGMWIEGTRFDNGEGGVELGDLNRLIPESGSLETAFQNTITKILQAGHRVVLIYPIPEVGWDVSREVGKRVKAHTGILSSDTVESWLKTGGLTTSLDRYFARTKSAFSAYNNIAGLETLIRVYPHSVFCSEQTRRCYTHDRVRFFYSDDDHLSLEGAQLLVDQIFTQVRTQWIKVN